jgi:hypothetical protein
MGKMARKDADTHDAADPAKAKKDAVAPPASGTTAVAAGDAGTGVAPRLITDFTEIYGAEYAEIKDIKGAAVARAPRTDHEMTGLALSGGGIRSASFSLGVMQAFNATGVLAKFDYLSTVSGGGYIGTSMTVAMSDGTTTADGKGVFPFGKTGQDVGETEATRHLRDNSRYLLQNGIGSALSAFVIYMRGIVMNVIIIVPFLLAAAALLAALTPTTRALTQISQLLEFLPDAIHATGWPLSILSVIILIALLVVYAIAVSVLPIKKKGVRKRAAHIATWIALLLCGLPIVFELHFAVLRIMFGPAHTPAGAGLGSGPFGNIAQVVAFATPVVAAILPFLRKIGEKAVSGATATVSDLFSKWGSRLFLLLAAAVVPLLLWLSMLQLAYWAIGVCPDTTCKSAAATWNHAPGFFGTTVKFLHDSGLAIDRWAGILYLGCAVILVIVWLFLNVNSNSLHQLYRDRLGSAFLFNRTGSGSIEDNDTFNFSEIKPRMSPYHIINTALNLPGSNFANKRGRNADFFMFSKLYTGSEATGYVETALAEKMTDGLNLGTAMAISGAAAAPNMGMASMRPLSATIALLNVRLGRWIRHPLDMLRYQGSTGLKLWWYRSPGPTHLLREAFFKSGEAISERNKAIAEGKKKDTSPAGFVFLTDGGHIENLGVYELLRRRCALIVAVDGEADPEFKFGSLTQLERFARIDFGTRIVMNCVPIGDGSRTASEQAKARTTSPRPGPHVAVGLIDYPPVPNAEPPLRQTGVLIYIKSSLSGDEPGYVTAYKADHPEFPQESTMEQLFSEEQFEVYRALGEHIGRRLATGLDAPCIDPSFDEPGRVSPAAEIERLAGIKLPPPLAPATTATAPTAPATAPAASPAPKPA